MIINGENLILGRLATKVAKKALLGEKIDIVNAEKIIIVGRKEVIFKNYKQKFDRKTPRKGPFIPRTPDRLVKRVIRNMLPYKKYRGDKALRSIMCYIGVPDKFKSQQMETFNDINVLNTNNIHYLTIKDLCKLMGKHA